MFFIQFGFCIVNIFDQNNVKHTNFNLLSEGDHFGEISLIYKCLRTASI